MSEVERDGAVDLLQRKCREVLPDRLRAPVIVASVTQTFSLLTHLFMNHLSSGARHCSALAVLASNREYLLAS